MSFRHTLSELPLRAARWSANHPGRAIGAWFAFVLIAVLAQIARNWLFLNAVGVEASVFDAIAVLIALVTLSTLPVGPGVGAAATVLILGPHGVAAAAAAGVLLTATGTAGGLAFAGALAELPAPQRKAIERAYFGGLSHIQIGRALRVPSAA